MTKTVEWFFGRGLSIECGLRWTVPEDWSALTRKDQVARIRQAIHLEMSASYIDTSDIGRFLGILATKTTPGWQHRFHTTNWDYLLQREVSLYLHLATRKPCWLASSHVYHHNGTAEGLSSDSFRSQFLLESDPQTARLPSPESNTAFQKLVGSRLFVVVGMSFECAVDRFLFSALNRIQDDLQVGESYWIVVNPSPDALTKTKSKILNALPAATISTQSSRFGCWIRNGLPELYCRGVLTY